MKNRLLIILVILHLSLIISCSDFLKEMSQDELRPSSVADLSQLLVGEAYFFHNDYFFTYHDLLTDDVEAPYSDGNESILLLGKAAYTWNMDVSEDIKDYALTNGFNPWKKYYEHIKVCNVVLSELDNVEGGYEEKMNVRAQALTLRAYCYFMLINIYCEPYVIARFDLDNGLGVPLMLDPTVKDEYPERESLAKVYEQIENDLLESIPLLEKYGTENGNRKVTDLFVHTLLSRFYLYMEEWDKSLIHSNFVISKKPILHNLSEFLSGYNIMQNVYTISSSELIWGYSSTNEVFILYPNLSIGVKPAFVVSWSLDNLYESDINNADDKKDLRTLAYFKRTTINGVTRKFQCRKTAYNYDGYEPIKGMRVAELYLNRAECYIEKYRESGNDEFRKLALKDLNYLRENRYDTRNVSYVDVNIINKDDLLSFCRDERRRELCFEEHRWFDLRRYGMPSIEHDFPSLNDNVKYKLEEKDKRYVLPIPQVVLDRNPKLVQNEY